MDNIGSTQRIEKGENAVFKVSNAFSAFLKCKSVNSRFQGKSLLYLAGLSKEISLPSGDMEGGKERTFIFSF